MTQFSNSTSFSLISFGLLMISGTAIDAQSRQPLKQEYGNLPLSFELNEGQTVPEVRFVSRGEGYSLFLTNSEAVLALQPNGKRSDVIRMQLRGANKNPIVSGGDQLQGKSNYFIGNNPANWQRNVPTFAKVSYKDVYPGVDLVYYGNQKQLEYDFILTPGANPDTIKLRLNGAKSLRVNKQGNIEIVATNGQVTLGHPVVYQQSRTGKTLIAGSFKMLSEDTISFVLGRYDHSTALVIDPTLTYATYLGGSGFHPAASGDCCGDSANGIAVDALGSAYVVGTTGSTDFPVSANAFQKINQDAQDQANGDAANVFVSKFDPTGSTLLYSTYLGGSGGNYKFKDFGRGIAVDLQGNAYITGDTGSSDFPVTSNAFQRSNKAFSNTGRNAFVTKLTADGSALIYSSYLGGSGFNSGTDSDGDFATGIAIDTSGNAFIVGSSYSADFPVTGGAFQKSNNAWPILQTNLFIAEINAPGSALIYSTYLGGTGITSCCVPFAGADFGTGIALDGLNQVYVTGYTYSKDFPVTSNAYQKVNNAHNSLNGFGLVDTNAFVTKLNTTGTTLLYSTYIGGSGNPYYGDQAAGIAVDSLGSAYITGRTGSIDFPITVGAFQPSPPQYNRPCAFATKVNKDGSSLIYSTYLGGTGNYNEGDYTSGIAVNTSGEAYVVGTTISWDLPVTPDAFQLVNNQGSFPAADYYAGNAFITQLNAAGSGMVYSSYFGGSGSPSGAGGDIGNAISLDGGGNAYIAGQTLSSNLPVTRGAYQIANKATAAGNPGSGNAFIAEFGTGSGLPLVPTTTAIKASANPQVAGVSITFTATVTSLIEKVLTGNIIFNIDGTVTSIVSLNSSGQATYSTRTLSAGTHTVEADFLGNTVLAPSSATLSEKVNADSVVVSFGTSPVGLSYSVDGITYSTPQSFTLAVGSTHMIATTSPQTSTGRRHTFTNWSNGGALRQTVTINTAGSYIADFNTAYLLTALANPTSGGTVSPGSGNYYIAGTSVVLTATPSSGYAFNIWTGNVAKPTDADSTITMSAPETVVASFVSAGDVNLFGNITGKSGSSAARVWNIQVSNNGPGAALATEIDNITFTQVGGTACTPYIATPLPVSAGDLSPGSSATIPVTISFNGCASNSRFTVGISLSANAGKSSGSIVRLNQFQ